MRSHHKITFVAMLGAGVVLLCIGGALICDEIAVAIRGLHIRGIVVAYERGPGAHADVSYRAVVDISEPVESGITRCVSESSENVKTWKTGQLVTIIDLNPNDGTCEIDSGLVRWVFPTLFFLGGIAFTFVGGRRIGEF